MKIYDANDCIILDVPVDDTSYRYRAVMGDNSLTLNFSLPEHVEIPTGAYCDFEGERYTLMRPQQLKMRHRRLYEYTAVFSSEQDKMKIWKFRNPVDGRLKFPLTAKPAEHLQMLVDNLNSREQGWTAGQCIDDTEKLVCYDHDFCWDALAKMASEFGTEFEVKGKTVSLRKVEYDKSDPLRLSYGRGNGLLPGVGRGNASEGAAVEILYVQGGDRNIDRSKYPPEEEEAQRAASNGCLLLPAGQVIAYDGEHFEDEERFNPEAANRYQADALGLYIRNIDRSPSTLAEDSLDRSEDYPKRVGEVSEAWEVDPDKHFWDFTDKDIPENLDYSQCLIGEERMSVVFQSGMLAGREFEVFYYHEEETAIDGQSKAARRFEIVPQEVDGMTMPGGDFIPRPGDKYAVFNVMLPPSYIRDDESKSGASWDMFRAAVRYLHDNEEPKLTFTGELDGLWAKKDWLRIGAKIRLGGFVRFVDEQFAPQGALVRIVGIKDSVNSPHSPQIELSNETVSPSVASTLKELKSEEVVTEENHKQALQFAKRRFSDAKETMEMISAALADDFSERINPVAVETMSMLVGDPKLQFRFVTGPGSDVAVVHHVTWDAASKTLIVPGGCIQHMTIDISDIAASHASDEYRYWTAGAYVSPPLSDPEAKYYLYVKAQAKAIGAGFAVFALEEEAQPFTKDGFYNLLYGILNAERDGERSFATLHGFTEILPGRITADRLVATDGESWFDMANASLKLKDKLVFNHDGNGELRLRGTIVQSQGGESEAPLGCYRGIWDSEGFYYAGDEVTYRPADDKPHSTYRCVQSQALHKMPPSSSPSWQVLAEGVKGEQGHSPALVYRGDFSPAETYYGTPSRRDCVKSGAAYFAARTDTPEGARGFRGRDTEQAAYWEPFGASFSSVATGLLLAEQAFIDNLGVRELMTATEGRRVHISQAQNRMTVHDEDGASSIVIAGETLSDSSLFGGAKAEYVIDRVRLQQKGESATSERVWGEERTFSFGHRGAFSAKVCLHVSLVYIQGVLPQEQEHRQGEQPAWHLQVFLGGKEIAVTHSTEENPASVSDREFLVNEAISAGSHKITTLLTYSTPPLGEGGEMNLFAEVIFKECCAESDIRQSNYFANGNAVGCSSSQYAETIMEDGKLMHKVEAGEAGFRLHDGELRVKLGGAWYTAARHSSTGALTLTPI